MTFGPPKAPTYRLSLKEECGGFLRDSLGSAGIFVIVVVQVKAGVVENRLADVDDFERFEIRILGVSPDVARRSLETIAVLTTDHAFVEPTELLSLPNARPEDGQWIEKFEAMVRFARSRGWVDETGRIRAHIMWDGLEIQ